MKNKTKNTKNKNVYDYDTWLMRYIESGKGLPPRELNEKMRKKFGCED